MRVKNNASGKAAGRGDHDSSTEIPGTNSNNTTYYRITRLCDLVVVLKGTGTVYIAIENGQTRRKVFDIKFDCLLQVELHFYLENQQLQVSTSFNWGQIIVIDPEEAVRLKLQITGGKLRTVITENGQTVLKQYIEITDTHVATEIAGARTEAIKDEDADADDTDLVFVEVSAPDGECNGETDEAMGNSVVATKSQSEKAAMKKDDDAADVDDEDDGLDFVEISAPE